MVFQTFYRTGLHLTRLNLYLHPLFTVPKKEIFSHLNWSVRLGVRTPDFHSGNTGSIPVQTTKTGWVWERERTNSSVFFTLTLTLPLPQLRRCLLCYLTDPPIRLWEARCLQKSKILPFLTNKRGHVMLGKQSSHIRKRPITIYRYFLLKNGNASSQVCWWRTPSKIRFMLNVVRPVSPVSIRC